MYAHASVCKRLLFSFLFFFEWRLQYDETKVECKASSTKAIGCFRRHLPDNDVPFNSTPHACRISTHTCCICHHRHIMWSKRATNLIMLWHNKKTVKSFCFKNKTWDCSLKRETSLLLGALPGRAVSHIDIELIRLSDERHRHLTLRFTHTNLRRAFVPLHQLCCLTLSPSVM